MEFRRKQFIKAIKKCSGHSEGNLYYYLLRYTTLNERFPGHKLQYRFRDVDDKVAARTDEAQLIKGYIREFGEVPPLK